MTTHQVLTKLYRLGAGRGPRSNHCHTCSAISGQACNLKGKPQGWMHNARWAGIVWTTNAVALAGLVNRDVQVPQYRRGVTGLLRQARG